MEKVYVITMETGRYEDFGVCIVSVTTDYEKGNAYVNKMNETYASMKQKMDSFNKKELVQWKNENPVPKINIHKIEVPKWTGNQLITPEMRQQKLEIQTKNCEYESEARKPLTKWNEDFKIYQDNWKKLNLTEEEFDIEKNNDHNYWNLEESIYI